MTTEHSPTEPHGPSPPAPPIRAPDPAVLRALAEHPYRFNFFQAVRLLMRVASRGAGEATTQPIGHDYAPLTEIVRFRAAPTLSFPQAEVTAFIPAKTDRQPDGPAPAEMTVSFLGLAGPAGALPQHYTQAVIDRLRLKDRTLQNFLDVFNHRTISLFYRAWEKHHVSPGMERALAEGREDVFTRAVYCLVGLGTPGVRHRLEVSDQTFLYYSGLFAHYPRNALSLERLIAEYLGLPTSIIQFQGLWLVLEPAEQTAMPDARRPHGLNARLGIDAIAGERVWSVESKFRIRLGPMSYAAFEQLLPTSRVLTQLGQLVRTYVGPELDFDVQPVLRRDEIPPCHLSPAAAAVPRLGWNTWVCSKMRGADAEEPVFITDGRPTR